MPDLLQQCTRLPAALLAGAGLFIVVTALVPMSESASHWWVNSSWIVSSLLAAVLCLRAAARAGGTDRPAWRDFGIGCLLWLGGTLYWASIDLRGTDPPFPSAADVGYFVACFYLVAGMYHFASLPAIRLVQMCNFALILCAAALSVSFLIYPQLGGSTQPLTATLIAVTYIVVSVATLAFGTVCLLLYVPRSKRAVSLLLLGGILALAAANVVYGLTILNARYRLGGSFDGLWVVGFVLIGLAATQHVRHGARDNAEADQRAWQRYAEAFVPAGAAALFTIVIVLVETAGRDYYFLSALPAALGFALALGVREHWSLTSERTLRHAAERTAREAAESRRRMVDVLESTTDHVLVFDPEWNVVYMNERAGTGTTATDRGFAVGKNIWEVYPELVGSEFDLNYRRAMELQRPLEFESHLALNDTWWQVHLFPSQEGLSVFYRDITERKTAQDKLTYLAQHDYLTGLDNRHRFRECLDKAIASASEGAQAAVLYFDLDEFKDINDSLGHPAGDEVLKKVAQRLAALVERDVTAARVGGDEFTVIRTGLKRCEEVEELAHRIATAVGQPYEVDGEKLKVGVSMGIALCPRDGRDPVQLFQKADIALYAAKNDGRGTYRFFEPAMAERRSQRQALKADLARALEASEFELAYQPLVDLRFDRIVSFEALLRWRHPERGLIAPGEFIPLAEETGAITAIGEWVISHACLDAASWAEDIGVAVNLSPVQFGKGTFPLRVAEALAKSGLAARRLELEITESVLLQDSDCNLAMLHQLRSLGVRIALDDFGTGYSSLSYLNRFPFDKIKIDRSFVAQLGMSSQAEAIVEAIASLGRALGIVIAAEGIETRRQLDLVGAHGCDQGQGYLYSPAVAASRVPSLITRWNTPSARLAVV